QEDEPRDAEVRRERDRGHRMTFAVCPLQERPRSEPGIAEPDEPERKRRPRERREAQRTDRGRAGADRECHGEFGLEARHTIEDRSTDRAMQPDKRKKPESL